MTAVVLSPHTDDAIFSLSAHITTLTDVTIVSVFSGLPADEPGRSKHTMLRAEHDLACKLLDVTVVNGDFLDDVYPPTPDDVVAHWLSSRMEADVVYVPVGIHHPDHLQLNRVAMRSLEGFRGEVRLYEELPYRVDYPHLVGERLAQQRRQLQRITSEPGDNLLKLAAVNCYTSQIHGDVVSRVMHTENIWSAA